MQKKYIFWDKYFPYIVTAIFLSLSIMLILRHEFWSDEVKAWNIAIGSSSIKEFISNMRNNYGHPYLWNAILYFISHFITRNPESMKAIHLLLSAIVCFLFLKYAPFSKIIRTLFVFGYFPFYEYSIVSRNYALGALAIVLFCIFYKEKYKNLIPLTVVLFFMGQAHLYSFIISLIFILLLIVDFIQDRKIILNIAGKTKLIIFFVMIAGGILLLYWELGSQLIQGTVWGPSIDTFFVESVQKNRELSIIPKSIISAFVYVPHFKLNYLNTNLIFTFLSKINSFYIYLLSLILFTFPVFLLKRKISYFYMSGILCLAGIIFFVYGSASRHFGLIFIFIIACFWISNDINKKNDFFINFKGKTNEKLINIFLIIILFISLAGSSLASYLDYRYPFSSGKQVSEYIKNNFEEDIIIVGYKDVDTHAISAYLDKDIFFPQINDFGRFCPYSIRANDVGEDMIFKMAFSFINSGKRVLSVVHCSSVQDSRIPEKYLFQRIKVLFDRSILGYENFCLYLFDKSFHKPFVDYNDYKRAEYENAGLLDDNKTLLFEEGGGELKIMKIPLGLKNNTDYLVSCEIKNISFDNDYINFDFFGNDYDKTQQEFSVPINYPPGQTIQVIQILNSGEVPKDEDIYFRIYSYADGSAKIENLEIYEISYSE